MQLSGACGYKNFLNGLTFVTHGYGANGAMVFKAWDTDQYLYYDLDCNGGGDGQPRWIIDYDAPNASRTEDLDEDNNCNYHARLDASEFSLMPPREATWSVYCGHEWVKQTLTFSETPILPDGGTGEGVGGGEHDEAPAAVRVKGRVCSYQGFLDGMDFLHVGATASGAPYYKAESAELYIFYDPDCKGSNSTSARWVIDEDAPSIVATQDLDGDRQCDYIGRALVADTRSPPKETMWRLHCGDGVWEDYWMTLEALPVTTTAEIPSVTHAHVAPKTTARPGIPQVKGDVSSLENHAGGLRSGTAALGAALSLLALLSADLAGPALLF